MRFNLHYDMADEEIASWLDFTERRRYVIRAMVPDGYETYFQEQARYMSAHTSTAIEGNPLSDEAAMLVLVEGAHADDPAGMEKVSLEEAYELMTLLASDKSTKIDQGIIRTINSMALKGLPDRQARTRGKYRVGQNLIVDAATREIRYRPPPPEWVPGLMNDFVENLDRWIEEYPGPIAAALAHFGLISIHPFDDGNGRTARLMADMVLELKGWSIEGMLSISKVFLDKRSEYYAALRESQGEQFSEEIDATPFVRFHTRALADAAATLEERVVIFNKRRDAWVRQVAFLNSRQVTALMFMLDIGPLSSSLYARLTKSSQATALTDLSQLVEQRLAIRDGAGRSTRYKLYPEVLQSVERTARDADPSSSAAAAP